MRVVTLSTARRWRAMDSAALSPARMIPVLAAKAELVRIGRYYATESMLVWDDGAQRYDAEATPSWGQETLGGHYERLLHSADPRRRIQAS